MAPLKFEDKMREKLEQRTIQPSKGSWKKLEKLLDDKEEKKNKSYWWLGIAASFVGILIIASFFIKSDSLEDDPAKKYVNATEKTTKTEENKIQIVELEQTETNDRTENANETLEPLIKKEVTDKIEPEPSLVTIERKNSNYTRNTKKGKSQTSIAITTYQPKKVLKTQEIVSIDSAGIQEKVIAIAAQVKELERNDVVVTEAEIDNLLSQAQREIAIEQLLKSNKVSASALLSDVESELDETFKEKVFEALKTGFQKLKTSVVERNN